MEDIAVNPTISAYRILQQKDVSALLCSLLYVKGSLHLCKQFSMGEHVCIKNYTRRYACSMYIAYISRHSSDSNCLLSELLVITKSSHQ